jgi:hypothetical protein
MTLTPTLTPTMSLFTRSTFSACRDWKAKKGGHKAPHLLLRLRQLLIHVAEPVLPAAHQILRLDVRETLKCTTTAVRTLQMLLMLLVLGLLLLLLLLVMQGVPIRELDA